MAIVAGIDGCPDGWCAIELDSRRDSTTIRTQGILTFDEVLAMKATIIGVDIPIGLLDRPGTRGCDTEARRLLGPPRASSVFPAPARQILSMDLSPKNYRSVSAANRRFVKRRLSKQTYFITPKIKEVFERMNPDVQVRVREVHPELSFWALNRRRSMKHNKKTREGQRERWRLVRKHVDDLPRSGVLPPELKGGCRLDDYIDALVVALTAASIRRGDAHRIPEDPPQDVRGLRMEMWYPTAPNRTAAHKQ